MKSLQIHNFHLIFLFHSECCKCQTSTNSYTFTEAAAHTAVLLTFQLGVTNLPPWLESRQWPITHSTHSQTLRTAWRTAGTLPSIFLGMASDGAWGPDVMQSPSPSYIVKCFRRPNISETLNGIFPCFNTDSKKQYFHFLLSFVKMYEPGTIHVIERTTRPVYDFMREKEASHLLLITTKVPLGKVSGLFCLIVRTFVCRTVQSLSTGWSSSVAWAVDATHHVQKKQNFPTMLIQPRLHRAATNVCTPGGS